VTGRSAAGHPSAARATATVTTPAATSDGLTFRYVAGSLPVTGTPIALYAITGLLLVGAPARPVAGQSLDGAHGAGPLDPMPHLWRQP
jgi:hypothetical protein